ncbi:MAG: VWA domain-containing protein [Pyrinomonadaceae bacterium]
MLNALSDCRRFASALLITLLLVSGAVSQSKEKPKLKDFGSSLKKLKWDPNQNGAVETKSKSKSVTNSTSDDVVRVETSLVQNDVLVLDNRGQPVQGLSAADFLITEDGTPQQVGAFSLGDSANVARSIVLVVDYGCLQLPFVRASMTAAKTLADKLGTTDRMAIVTDDVELLIDFTNDKKKLKEKLEEVAGRPTAWRRLPGLAENDLYPDRLKRLRLPFGRGLQYSALLAVLKEAFNVEDERPVIIFQTDGSEIGNLRNPIVSDAVAPGLPPDLKAYGEKKLELRRQYLEKNPHEFSLNDVYKAAEKSRATIYSVVPSLRFIGLKPEERAPQMRAYLTRNIAGLELDAARKHVANYLNHGTDESFNWDADNLAKMQSALAVLSTITGGWIEFFDQPSRADEIYSRILADMNRRYLVGYYPTNKEHDGKRRKINITVRNHPEYMVMSHKAYYAPAPE